MKKTLRIDIVLLSIAISFICGSVVTTHFCARKVDKNIQKIDHEISSAAAAWRARNEACESLLKRETKP
jgi:hypothetical protein